MIKINVIMITYNHELFIKEAIEGVLMQQGDFILELIIANDCSTDKTDDIIKNILESDIRAKKIKYISHSENIGMQNNFVSAFNLCDGKYIALCEGDDYWTDPLKLQKQVDFLEGNGDYSICFHNVKIYNQDDKTFQKDTITRDVSQTTSEVDLAKGNYIHTPSVVLRNDFTIPSWFTNVHLGDWSLYMLSIKGRKIFRFEEEMAVYRLHSQSIWSKLDQDKRNGLTKANVNILLENLKSTNESKNVLRNRLGIKVAEPLLKRILSKIKQKISTVSLF